MNLRTILSRLMGITTVLGVTAFWPLLALAQQEPEEPADKSGWLAMYGLTILAIILGLVAVCRPGNRSKEVRLEDD